MARHLFRHDGPAVGFLLEAAANATGTLISAAILGNLAIRVGILDVNEDALYLTAHYSLMLGISLAGIGVIAIMTLLLLRLIEPQYKVRHLRRLFSLLQAAFVVAIVLTTAFWAAVMAASWDPESIIVWSTTTAGLVAAIVLTRALANRLLPDQTTDEN